MTDPSWNQLLRDQLEWHWDNQLRPRLEELTDDELAWQQGEEVPTIQWRLDHVIWTLADRSARHFGRDPVAEETYPFSPTADGTLELLDQEYATWLAGVRSLGEEGLLLPCGPGEGPWHASPKAAIITHVHKEVIHHGAEVALLRDLYAVRSLRGARLVERDLRDARFVSCGLSGVVMRGVDVQGMQVDAPWLLEDDEGSLVVNDVDVAPYVDAELDRRFPGRAQRRAADPDGLRAAWAALESTWAATVERAGSLPAGVVDESVDGEWSFAQTLRHLVLATDMWLGRAVLGVEQPFHPLGLRDDSLDEEEGFDTSVFATDPPTYAEVLAARADRQAMVRDFLAGVTSEELATQRANPHEPDRPATTLSCLHVILEEEWEHHRFAVRDLAVIEARVP
ncbi:MAG TPA: DinB family protein [Nocardioides sp.]|uniref:DinB family protein n=1 Tax=Nocardioides sp. TaxID=35761 RepID=UPI002E321F44|nr:DinB family protein [Nocardioides sp.]HEX5090900.1 DinB family protein [Nocardioides sp.]